MFSTLKYELEFLEKEYGLQYQFQRLSNCWGGNWWMDAHSFFNDTGCFTAAVLEQRQEIHFFFAPQFGDSFESLCQKSVDLEVGADFSKTQVWKEYRSIFPTKPFFPFSERRVVKAYAQLIRDHVLKTGDLYGVKVSQVTPDIH